MLSNPYVSSTGRKELDLGAHLKKRFKAYVVTLLQGIGTGRGGSGLELIFRRNSKAHGCGECLV